MGFLNIPVTVGSLFSGIGGLELGLERTNGFEVKWQVEINDYATKVLEKHWPDVRRYKDVRELKEGNKPESVDLICGGFPCQDISTAGKGEGIEGERSGLWFEMLRIIRLVRPQYVLIENVSALTFRGLDTILCGLSKSGYNAEWNIVSARSVGAPHLRKRIFIMAYPMCERRSRKIGMQIDRCSGHQYGKDTQILQRTKENISNTNSKGLERRENSRKFKSIWENSNKLITRYCNTSGAFQWGTDPAKIYDPESRVGRVAHGISSKMVGCGINETINNKKTKSESNKFREQILQDM